MKQRKENDLGRDSVLQLVLKLAIPSMIAQFVNVAYGIVDRIYIGNIPEIGNLALAGVGVCGPIMTLISSFSCLVGLGGAPLMAMRMGEGNHEDAKHILSNCLVMLASLAVLMMTVCFIFKDNMLMTFGASSDTFPYANQYMTVYLLGTLFAIVGAGLNQFIICQGFSDISMTTVLLGALLNIILDPICIFVLNMGVVGAALATVISQAASCAFVFWFLLGKRVTVKLSLGGYSSRIMRRVLTFGLSPFLIVATDSVVLIALNSALQKYGGASQGDMLVTCATIVQSYMQIITMPMGGITGGTQPILSFNYGAKKIQRIRQGERYILLMCVIFTSIMFVFSQTIPQIFVRIFTQDSQLINIASWGVRVSTLAIIPLAFQYTFVDGLTALGIARVAVTLSLFRKGLLTALTLLLPAFMGATAAFYAEPIADAISCVTATTTFLLLFNRIMMRRNAMKDGEQLYG